MNSINYIACKRLEDKNALCYDSNIIKEIRSFSRQEIMEIVLLNMTKQDVISSLEEIYDSISDITNSVTWSDSTEGFVDRTQSLIENLERILGSEG